MAHQATKSLIVKGELSEIFDLWANFEIFPNFMKPINSVVKTGERTSHWVVEGPFGKTLEWDAETTTFEKIGASHGTASTMKGEISKPAAR